jgi:hypothetical protein
MNCSGKYFRPGRRMNLTADGLGDEYSAWVPHHQETIPSSTSPLCFPPPCSASPSAWAPAKAGRALADSAWSASITGSRPLADPRFLPPPQPPSGVGARGAPAASAAAAFKGRSAPGAASLRHDRLKGMESAGRCQPPRLLRYGEGVMTATSVPGPHRQGPPWWGKGCWRIFSADFSSGKGQGGGAAGVGHGEIGDGPSRSKVTNRVAYLRCWLPRSEVTRVGPVLVCWARAFFWCGAKLRQIWMILVVFFIPVSNLVNLWMLENKGLLFIWGYHKTSLSFLPC